MERIYVKNLAELNDILSEGRYYANGKNIPVDHLYATAANSRWKYENIWGIYLTNEYYSWMALWMAVTSRDKIRKRQIRYIAPKKEGGDFIGTIEIYNPDDITHQDIFCDNAYLYLFSKDRFLNMAKIDLRNSPNGADLFSQRFQSKEVAKSGELRECYVSRSTEPIMTLIDNWQVACINIDQLVPDKELILTKELIDTLSRQVSHTDKEIGQDYILE